MTYYQYWYHSECWPFLVDLFKGTLMRNGYISPLRWLIKMSYPLARKFCICQLRKCRQHDSSSLLTVAAADRHAVVRMILGIKKIHAPSHGDINFPSSNYATPLSKTFRVHHANSIMMHRREKMR